MTRPHALKSRIHHLSTNKKKGQETSSTTALATTRVKSRYSKNNRRMKAAAAKNRNNTRRNNSNGGRAGGGGGVVCFSHRCCFWPTPTNKTTALLLLLSSSLLLLPSTSSAIAAAAADDVLRGGSVLAAATSKAKDSAPLLLLEGVARPRRQRQQLQAVQPQRQQRDDSGRRPLRNLQSGQGAGGDGDGGDGDGGGGGADQCLNETAALYEHPALQDGVSDLELSMAYYVANTDPAEYCDIDDGGDGQGGTAATTTCTIDFELLGSDATIRQACDEVGGTFYQSPTPIGLICTEKNDGGVDNGTGGNGDRFAMAINFLNIPGTFRVVPTPCARCVVVCNKACARTPRLPFDLTPLSSRRTPHPRLAYI